MVEELNYKIIKKIGKVELRSYPDCIMATTSLPLKDRNAAFRRIAGYIFGGNKQQKQIAMTAPVIMRTTSKFHMSFIMPKNYSMKDLPVPNSRDVKIERIDSRKMAVLRFSGFMNEDRIREKTQELLEILESSKIKYKGEPIFMGYNAPWTLPIFRRNEVAVEI
jgi:hypothetical protein